MSPPPADAYVSAAKPKANYGSTTRLKADATPTMDTFVRFSGGSLTGQITRATLWLYGVTSSSEGYSIHAVSDTSWNESSITYANAPLIPPTTVGSAGGFGSGTWTTVDVTSIISAAGAANLAVTSPATSALNFSSREAGTKSPVLVVETTSPDVSPPTAPTGLAVTATTGSSISLSWNAASDNVAVAGYGVYSNGSLVTSTQQTTQTLSGLACGTSYSVSVDAYDRAVDQVQIRLLEHKRPGPDAAVRLQPDRRIDEERGGRDPDRDSGPTLAVRLRQQQVHLGEG